MTDLSARLTELLTEATVTARRITMQLFVQELMLALAKENYRLNDLSEALAEYAKRRDDWGTVVHHLQAAAAEVVRVKNNLSGRSD